MRQKREERRERQERERRVRERGGGEGEVGEEGERGKDRMHMLVLICCMRFAALTQPQPAPFSAAHTSSLNVCG